VTQAAAAVAMLGGRRVRPQPPQQEGGMKAGKELLLGAGLKSVNWFLDRVGLRQQEIPTHHAQDQRRRSSGRLLRGL
jgi:hypothetical protein